ncbi:MAG: hypothetical protein ABFD86_01350 [Bryobacteraceae bacterium]
MRWLLAVSAVMILTGCAARGPRRFVLTEDALIPPVVRQPLRLGRVSLKSCEVASGPLKASTRRHNLYLRRTGGAVSSSTLREFRDGLAGMEANGCLMEGGAQLAFTALTDMLALPSASLFLARYGMAHDSASIDVEPGFFLRVVSPLLRAGASDLKLDAEIPDQPGVIHVKAGKELEGFETSYYAVEASRSAVVFSLVSVEHSRMGKVSSASAPAGYRLQPPETARCFRMLFLRRRSDSDRNLTLLGAGSRAELDAAQRRMESAADPMVACSDERSAWCQPIPRLSAVAPMLRVTVNEKNVFVHVHGTIGDAIQAAGFPRRQGRWAVERFWQGRLVPLVVSTRPEALFDLVLLGEERITLLAP